MNRKQMHNVARILWELRVIAGSCTPYLTSCCRSPALHVDEAADGTNHMGSGSLPGGTANCNIVFIETEE